MTEIRETFDLTTKGDDGWAIDRWVRRDDGGDVLVQARCTRTAEMVARAQDNRASLVAIADQCTSAALDFAERAQSPLRRGRVIAQLWFNPYDGSLLHDYDYELPLESA